MRPFHALSAAALGLVLVAHLPAQARPPQLKPVPAYTVVPLAGQGSYARAINKAGEVAGRLIPPLGGERGFRSSRGVLTELGTLPGDTDSVAVGINNRGEVVGSSSGLTSPRRAFLYSGGVMRDIGRLPGGGVTAASDINDAGHIVGGSVLQRQYTFAFLYRNGIMQNLGALPSGDLSIASGINNRGQVVGSSGIGPSDVPLNQTHAFLWENGVMRDLGTLGGENSAAEDINERGQVVGYATRKGGDTPEREWRGFIWSNGRMRDLGAPAGGSMVRAMAVNNRGDAVGVYVGDNRQRAFLYRHPGRIVDLNALVDPAQGWFVTIAYDINDTGQIVGEACDFTFMQCNAVRLDPLKKDRHGRH